jgi:hypothetical protein
MKPTVGQRSTLVFSVDNTVEMLETTRTYAARITNQQQVRDALDQYGFSVSK